MKIRVPGLGTIYTVEEVRTKRTQLDARTSTSRKAAAEKCAAEKRAVKAENLQATHEAQARARAIRAKAKLEADREASAATQAAEGRAARHTAAASRRCRIRDSAIRREARELKLQLGREERAARRDLPREQRAPVRRAARAMGEAPRHPRTGKLLTAGEREERIDEARSALAEIGGSSRVEGSADAALWFYTRARLRSMLRRMKPTTASGSIQNLYELAPEDYADHHFEVDAAYADHIAKTGGRAERSEGKAAKRAYQVNMARTRPVLLGAPVGARGLERIRAALVAWGHLPRLGRAAVVCGLCGGRGRIEAHGAKVALVGDAKLRARCMGQRYAPVPF